jgi:predicted dehydrogenase
MKKLKAIVFGFGSRGSKYAHFACQHPEQLEIVAVADPLRNRLNTAKETHGLDESQLYTDWKEIAKLPKMADFVVISTQDQMHYEPALAMIEKGYDILLEKPMAPTPKECKEITEAAEKKGVKVIVGHVLRFTPFWKKLKAILDEGTIGDIVSVIHTEAVGNAHQSHSFVRGHWRNTAESTPMILAKSCHDTDIIQWLLGKECKQVQSFGSLTYFVKENRPDGAPDYCVKGCPAADTCFYNAVKLYYDDKENLWFRKAATRKVEPPTDEEVWEAISTGPYGRCVFACDNDVVDHQVVNMEFEGGVTVTFTMNAFNKGGRDIRIFGTAGELTADMDRGTIRIYSFETKETTEITMKAIAGTITSGHGGGDTGIMEDLVQYFNDEEPSNSVCSLRTSYMNHLISFAAEEARVENKIVNMKEYEKNI